MGRLAEVRLDAPLLEELRGDEEFDVVYRRFFPRLVRMLRRQTGDVELAEDIAQDTLVKALQHLDSFDYSRPMWPWLKTIALHLFYDHGKKASREIPGDLPPAPAQEPNWFSPDALPQAMASLPRRHQVALGLRYLDDWDPSQAAEFLGLSRGAFEQLLFRARRRLRTEYVRISETAVAIPFMPGGARRWIAEGTLRLRRFVDGLGAPTWAATADVRMQVAVGTLAVISALGSPSLDALRPGSVHHPLGEVTKVEIGVPDTGIAELTRRLDGKRVETETRKEIEQTSGHVAERVAQVRNIVRQPEDTEITSVQGSDDGSLFASGRNSNDSCTPELCSRVLFRSTDGGATWTRLPAENFAGDSLLIPRRQTSSTRTLFAIGPLGLQVSYDGGMTFAQAPLVDPKITGDAAISPAFNSGDPTILIGAQTLLRYRADVQSLEPGLERLTGPLRPAFAPSYPTDPWFFVGGTKFEPATGKWMSTVYTCIAGGPGCAHELLAEGNVAPRIRLDPRFTRTRRVFAFTDSDAFLSEDGGSSFSEFPTPPTTGRLADIAIGHDRKVFAAIEGSPDAGLYVSRDTGATWTQIDSSLFADGVRSVLVTGFRLFATLPGSGLACSSDGGATWARRCAALVKG